jgi:hypothetical protein
VGPVTFARISVRLGLLAHGAFGARPAPAVSVALGRRRRSRT